MYMINFPLSQYFILVLVYFYCTRKILNMYVTIL